MITNKVKDFFIKLLLFLFLSLSKFIMQYIYNVDLWSIYMSDSAISQVLAKSYCENNDRYCSVVVISRINSGKPFCPRRREPVTRNYVGG